MAHGLRIRLAALQLRMTERSGDENDDGGDAAGSQAQDGPSQ
jgi:hypothetical protein